MSFLVCRCFKCWGRLLTLHTVQEKHVKLRVRKTCCRERRGIKVDLIKCIMAQVICVYITVAQFIFYYSWHCIGPRDNSLQMCVGIPGVSEQHPQGWWGDSEPSSHLSHLPSLFPCEIILSITLSVAEKGAFWILNFSVSTYCLNKCMYFISDLYVCFSPSIIPESHFPPLCSLGWRR